MNASENTVYESERPFFGWRICPQRWLNGATPGSGNTPYLHVFSRAIALLYIVFLHIYLTYATYQKGRGWSFLARYPLYATYWALFCSMLYFAFVNWYTFSRYSMIRKIVGPPQETDNPAMPKFLRICAGLLQVSTIAQLTITSMFWGWVGLFNRGEADAVDIKSTFLAFQTHGVVCLCVAVEYFFTRIPAFWIDIIVTAMIFVVYCCVNATYTRLTGSNVYPVLTWEDDITIAMIGGGLLYFVLWVTIMRVFAFWQRGTWCFARKKQEESDAGQEQRVQFPC